MRFSRLTLIAIAAFLFAACDSVEMRCVMFDDQTWVTAADQPGTLFGLLTWYRCPNCVCKPKVGK